MFFFCIKLLSDFVWIHMFRPCYQPYVFKEFNIDNCPPSFVLIWIANQQGCLKMLTQCINEYGGGVATPTYSLSAGPFLQGFTFPAFKNTTKYGTIFLILFPTLWIHRRTGYWKRSIDLIERYRSYIVHLHEPYYSLYQQTVSRNEEGNICKPRIFRKPRKRYKCKVKPKTVSKIHQFLQIATVRKTKKPHQFSWKTENPQLKTSKTANRTDIIGPQHSTKMTNRLITYIEQAAVLVSLGVGHL